MRTEARLRRIEEKRAALLDRASATDPALLAARPRAGKWSILELVEHLVLSEEDVLGDLGRLDGREPLARSLKDRVLFLVVMFVLRFDIPVRAPSKGMIPRGSRSLTELRARWEDNHRHLSRYVGGLDRVGARRPILRHPVAGPLSVSQALWMLEVHLDRHVRQIRAREQSATGSQVSRRGPLDLSTEAHRQLIGYLGLLLPGLLWVLAGLRPTEPLPTWRPLESVSAYYYTGAVAVFVGVLFGLGLFLFTYRGYADSWADRALGRAGALCALCVALFPTRPPPGVAAPDWWSATMVAIHNVAASLLFMIFVLFSLWLFRRSDAPKGEALPDDKRFRNHVYVACGVVMIVCILWAGSALVRPGPIFWPEAIALWAFAVSWLVKGRAARTLLRLAYAPLRNQERGTVPERFVR